MTETERKPLPPYLPYKTFVTFLDHLRSIGVPSHIDNSVMASLAGGMRSWLKAALRYMKLVDTEDAPTPRLIKLAESEGEERKVLLLDLFKSSYSFLKLDLKNTTPVKLKEAIVDVGATGETVEKIISFMVAMAKDAGVPLSPLLTTRAPVQRRPRTKPTGSKVASMNPDEFEDDDEIPAGSLRVTKSINIGNGKLTLIATFNPFELSKTERDLVYKIVDSLQDYPQPEEK